MDKIRAAIVLCFIAFIIDFLFSTNFSSAGNFGRQNQCFRFGKQLGDLQQDDRVAVNFKTAEYEFKVIREDVLNEEIVTKLNSSERGVLILDFEVQGKWSIIKDFLCTAKTFDRFPICDRIIFHHMCTFDDDLSSDPVEFVIHFGKAVIGLSPNIGYTMYFDSTIEDYLNATVCSLNPLECLKRLIISPLTHYSHQSPSRKYLIVVNCLDNCDVGSNSMNWTIFRILKILKRQLPSQFKFIFISRTRAYNINKIDTINLYDLLEPPVKGRRINRNDWTYYDNDATIGFCTDSIEIALLFVYLCCCFVKQAIVSGVVIYSTPIRFICYVKLIMRDKETYIGFAHRNWFYRLDLKCDNIDIHCIVDYRLERKYVHLNKLYEEESFIEQFTEVHRIHRTLKDIDRTSMCEFELLYTFKLTESEKDLNRNLVEASSRKMSILSRWLISQIRDKKKRNTIERALDVAFTNHDNETAKAISWYITRSFYQTFNLSLKTCLDIYPALYCTCCKKYDKTYYFCSQNRLIAIRSRDKVKGLPKKYMTFKIHTFMVGDIEDVSEGKTVTELLSAKYEDSQFLKLNITSDKSEQLFSYHSNLTLICPSALKSVSFKNVHEVKEELCVQLYCKIKGIIPLGERHFPDFIYGIQTDVLEGDVNMISNMHIGDKIGPPGINGTLGGFIRYMDFDCFLTCAHVMFDIQTLLSSNFWIPGAIAYKYTSNGTIECGKVLWKAFEHDDKQKTSIDAAVVLLKNFIIDPNDYVLDVYGNKYPFSQLGLASPYLNNSYLEHEEFCVTNQSARIVAVGALSKHEHSVQFQKQEDKDIHFANTGATAANVNTNLYHPLWIYTPAHMQISNGYVPSQRIFRMYNQIVINLGLQPGDSGTCIYIVQHPANKNGCIGMAIAFCSGLTIVTPLKDILKRITS